jgi:hypothetical protein
MASSGTPLEGRDAIAARVYTSGLTLVLYTNTQDSLSSSTVLADLTFPTGDGADAKTLSGTWSSSDGVVTYDDGTPDDPVFENTHASNNWSAAVTGAAIHDGTALWHFKDFDDGAITMTPGKKIRVDLSSLVAP